MEYLTPVPGDDAVPQIETTTPLLGGPGGPLNLQAQALLNRFAALGAEDGAGKVGNGGESVQASLNALQLDDYTALRAYGGPRKSVYVIASGIAGVFVRDDSDTIASSAKATCDPIPA